MLIMVRSNEETRRHLATAMELLADRSTLISMEASDRMGPGLAEDPEMVVPAAEVSHWTGNPPVCE